MKRVVAIIFLSLATIIIAAHAIIPHHHHEGIPVVLSSETCKKAHESLTHNLCYQHDQSHLHDNDCYAHDKGSSSEDCLINDLYIRIENDKNSNLSNDDESLQNIDFIVLFYTNPVLESPQYTNLPFREKPYLEHYHTIFITRSLGLRAPPVC